MKAELDLKAQRLNLEGEPQEIGDLICRINIPQVILPSVQVILDRLEIPEAITISGSGTNLETSKPPMKANPARAGHKRRGRASELADAEIVKLYNAGKTPREMAKALKFSAKTIYNRLYKLDKAQKIKYEPKHPKLAKGKKAKAVSSWAKEDDDKLRELAEPPSEYLSKMAQLLKRPEDDIASRLKELGLSAAAG